MIIVGITGTLGAGKGTIVEYLAQKMGFAHLSVRDFITCEIEKRGLPVDRDSMTAVANDLRAHHSPSYIVDQLYAQARKSNQNCIIESIRTPGEIDSLKSKGSFFLFAVDADPKIRYQRIRLRKSATDNVGFETFLDNEKREMTSSDPNKQNLQKCRQMADHVFQNNGTIGELQKQLEIIMQQVLTLK
jgi:dephospho-CoA kinase